MKTSNVIEEPESESPKEDIKLVEKQQLKPQERLSPTSINAYYKCPLQYFLSYIAKIKMKANINLIKGNVVHSSLDDFFKVYRRNLKEHMEKLLEKHWTKNAKNLIETELPQDKLDIAKKDCSNILTEYYEGFKRKLNAFVETGIAENESHAYYLTKPKFREKFLEDKTLHCCGYLDRITEDFNNVLTLADYKTSKKYGVGLPEDYKRQLAIYSLLYANQEKRTPDFASVIFLRFGEEYLLEVTPSLLKYARDSITDVYGKTRSASVDDYPKKEGNLCRWCDFKDICDGKEDWEKTIREQKMKDKVNKK